MGLLIAGFVVLNIVLMNVGQRNVGIIGIALLGIIPVWYYGLLMLEGKGKLDDRLSEEGISSRYQNIVHDQGSKVQ
jgi:hypothetical protein